MFASAILLYCSNHSLGFPAFIPPNSISFTWFDSFSTWFISKLASVKTFTNAVTFGSNPLAFPSGVGLKSPSNSFSNPDDSNGNDGLLLLLFPKGRLLLFPKAPNPSNRFASIMLKYKKCPPPMFPMLVALF